MEYNDHLPIQRETADLLRFTDVSLPGAWTSKRTLQNIKAYSALLDEYRHFLVAVRHFSVELDKLRDLSAYTHAARLAVQVCIARHEQELAAMQEEAEIARMERAIKKASLQRQIAEHTTPTSDALVELQATAQAIVALLQASGVSEDSALLAAVRAELCATILQKLT